MHFRKACDCGRGAVFLSVARGKIAEGIDFDEHYGRCVIMFGIPFQYTKSRILLARLEYLNKEKNIKESEFLIFDAMRQGAQCLGRVVRGKNDYGLMVLADRRFSKADKREKLPQWILKCCKQNNMNLSTDMALAEAREYFKNLSQDFVLDKIAYYDENDFKQINQDKMIIEK